MAWQPTYMARTKRVAEKAHRIHVEQKAFSHFASTAAAFFRPADNRKLGQEEQQEVHVAGKKGVSHAGESPMPK